MTTTTTMTNREIAIEILESSNEGKIFNTDYSEMLKLTMFNALDIYELLNPRERELFEVVAAFAWKAYRDSNNARAFWSIVSEMKHGE